MKKGHVITAELLWGMYVSVLQCHIFWCTNTLLYNARQIIKFPTKYFFRLLRELVFPHLLNLVPNGIRSLSGYKYGWPLASFPFC
jgi:hypothetical protein